MNREDMGRHPVQPPPPGTPAGVECYPFGPRDPRTPGPYCAPLRCYCAGSPTNVKRGPVTTVDGEPLFLNPAEGQHRKRTGMARALSARDEWRERARVAVRALAASGVPFTSEDVVARVGLPTGAVGTNANNAVGALVSAAARAGVIEPTGRLVASGRPSSHGATLREWRGVRRDDPKHVLGRD